MTRLLTRLSQSLRRTDDGSIAVEFALVAPLLLLILAGVVDIGGAAYTKLELDARVTAAAEFALIQPTPGDQAAAQDLAEQLVGLLQGRASETAEVVVNNAAVAQWTGSTVTAGAGSGSADECYCPAVSDGAILWGAAMACGSACSSGATAGQFLHVSAAARHVTMFPGYAFIEEDTVKTSTVLRLP